MDDMCLAGLKGGGMSSDPLWEEEWGQEDVSEEVTQTRLSLPVSTGEEVTLHFLPPQSLSC